MYLRIIIEYGIVIAEIYEVVAVCVKHTTEA